MVSANLTRSSRDGLDLFLREWSPETEPKSVICLIHGLGEHSGRFSHVADAMTAQGFAVLAMDLRGHGRSLGRRGDTPSYEALLNDVYLLIAEARLRFPKLPVFLYGHSMGANLVLNYVLRRRPEVTGVIVTGPWLRLTRKPPVLQMAFARLMVHLYPSLTQSNGLNPIGLSHDPKIAEAYTYDPLVHDKITLRLFFAIHNAGEWALRHAREFAPPLLIMHGSDDPITSSEASKEFGSNSMGCTLKIWDGLYHEIHNEPEKNDILETIVHWIDERLTLA